MWFLTKNAGVPADFQHIKANNLPINRISGRLGREPKVQVAPSPGSGFTLGSCGSGLVNAGSGSGKSLGRKWSPSWSPSPPDVEWWTRAHITATMKEITYLVVHYFLAHHLLCKLDGNVTLFFTLGKKRRRTGSALDPLANIFCCFCYFNEEAD